MNCKLILCFFVFMVSILIMISSLTSNFHNSYVKTLPTIEEQKIENDEFLKAYENIKKIEEKNEKNKTPLTWNSNNTLESMQLKKPCLDSDETGRLTCFTAPAWWYPKDKYDPNKFRSIYYGDYYNPIYNYLGNAQEMYWDFKSVKN
jgi:hypothetical protein